MASHRSLSENKSPQVPRTLLSILSDFDSDAVWIVSTHLVISKSSSPWINPLVTVPGAPIAIGLIITCMFHSFFFTFLVRSRYLSLFLFSFDFTLWSVHNFTNSLFFLLTITQSSCQAEIWWSVHISKSQRSLCISFSKMNSGWCIYHLIVRWNFNFLHYSYWINLPTQLCLVLYSFCASLLHSLIMWLIVLSLL